MSGTAGGATVVSGTSQTDGAPPPPFIPVNARCLICGGRGAHEAFYCRSCVLLEKDRDGCPRITNTSARRRDVHYNAVPSSGKGGGAGM